MRRQIVGILAYVLLFGGFLFGGAGTMHWRAAWILLAVLFAARTVSTVRLYAIQRGLLEERARLPLPRDQVSADRVLLFASMASFAGMIAFAGADRWRLHLFPGLPLLLRVAGLVIFASGWWVVHLALAANAFAVTVVRYQADRGQVVVDKGPYLIVRHPMYTGITLVMIGIALWLGSTAAVIATSVPLSILGLRILVEERMLRSRLEGYNAYASRVRWRLIPGVW